MAVTQAQQPIANHTRLPQCLFLFLHEHTWAVGREKVSPDTQNCETHSFIATPTYHTSLSQLAPIGQH
jgi:hypothetical protein